MLCFLVLEHINSRCYVMLFQVVLWSYICYVYCMIYSSYVVCGLGYHSFENNPGKIFECFGDSERCPGGLPGTCAAGRDTNTVACSQCLPGLHGVSGKCSLEMWTPLRAICRFIDIINIFAQISSRSQSSDRTLFVSLKWIGVMNNTSGQGGFSVFQPTFDLWLLSG
jgi:hypothetical protein